MHIKLLFNKIEISKEKIFLLFFLMLIWLSLSATPANAQTNGLSASYLDIDSPPFCNTSDYPDCYITQSAFNPSEINFDNFKNYLISETGQGQYVAMRLFGFIKVDYSETYTFKSETQWETLYLYIDDNLVIYSASQTGEGTIYLDAGWHRISINYYQWSGGAKFKLAFQSAQTPFQYIPLDHLMYENVSSETVYIPAQAQESMKMSFKTAGLSMKTPELSFPDNVTQGQIKIAVPVGVDKENVWLFASGRRLRSNLTINGNSISLDPFEFLDGLASSGEIYKYKIPSSWVPNPGNDLTLTIDGMDASFGQSVKGNPGSLTNPYGIYVWQDDVNAKKWYFRTTFAPSGTNNNYKNTKIISFYAKIKTASYYSADEGQETLSCYKSNGSLADCADPDILKKTVVVDKMKVNGTGGVDGINLVLSDDEDWLTFQIVMSNYTLTPSDIYLGDNNPKVHPLHTSFTVSHENAGLVLVMPYQDESKAVKSRLQIKAVDSIYRKKSAPIVFSFPSVSQDLSLDFLFVVGDGETRYYSGSEERPNYLYFARGSGVEPGEFDDVRDYAGTMFIPQTTVYNPADSDSWLPSWGREGMAFDILSTGYSENPLNPNSYPESNPGLISSPNVNNGDSWAAFQLFSLTTKELGIAPFSHNYFSESMEGLLVGLSVPEGNQPPSASDLTVTSPTSETYCASSPLGFHLFSWIYNDDNDYEAKFQFQVDDKSNFSDCDAGINCEVSRLIPETGSLDLPNGSPNNQSVTVVNGGGADKLDYGKTYYWRVKVFDSGSPQQDSGWIEGPSFQTANHAYPAVEFSWLPSTPQLNKTVTFTDESVVYGNGNPIQSWSWTFENGAPPTSSDQNPSVLFIQKGNSNVSLTVVDSTPTDKGGPFSCTVQKTIRVIQEINFQEI